MSKEQRQIERLEHSQKESALGDARKYLRTQLNVFERDENPKLWDAVTEAYLSAGRKLSEAITTIENSFRRDLMDKQKTIDQLRDDLKRSQNETRIAINQTANAIDEDQRFKRDLVKAIGGDY